MILNSAFIENRKFDGVTINDTKEFIDKLLAAKDLVADVYINRKLVCSGMLKLMLNNNWIIGCVDERLSIINMAGPATNLHILVHQLDYDTTDDIILSVESPLSTFLEPGDLDSDLYFAVISTVPNCTQRCFVPDSTFRNLRTSNIPAKDFNECADDPTVVTTPTVTYYLEISDKGYSYAYFTASNTEEEHDYNWAVNCNKVDEPFVGQTNGTYNLTIEIQNPQDPRLAELENGEGIDVSVQDADSEEWIISGVLATKVDAP